MKRFVKSGTPITGIIIPVAFFLSVLDPESIGPNGFIYLAYVGFLLLAATLITLGIGLVESPEAKKKYDIPTHDQL